MDETVFIPVIGPHTVWHEEVKLHINNQSFFLLRTVTSSFLSNIDWNSCSIYSKLGKSSSELAQAPKARDLLVKSTFYSLLQQFREKKSAIWLFTSFHTLVDGNQIFSNLLIICLNLSQPELFNWGFESGSVLLERAELEVPSEEKSAASFRQSRRINRWQDTQREH